MLLRKHETRNCETLHSLNGFAANVSPRLHSQCCCSFHTVQQTHRSLLHRATRFQTWLLTKEKPEGLVFSFIFSQVSAANASTFASHSQVLLGPPLPVQLGASWCACQLSCTGQPLSMLLAHSTYHIHCCATWHCSLLLQRDKPKSACLCCGASSVHVCSMPCRSRPPPCYR